MLMKLDKALWLRKEPGLTARGRVTHICIRGVDQYWIRYGFGSVNWIRRNGLQWNLDQIRNICFNDIRLMMSPTSRPFYPSLNILKQHCKHQWRFVTEAAARWNMSVMGFYYGILWWIYASGHNYQHRLALNEYWINGMDKLLHKWILWDDIPNSLITSHIFQSEHG